jgi:hypothetical protein
MSGLLFYLYLNLNDGAGECLDGSRERPVG